MLQRAFVTFDDYATVRIIILVTCQSGPLQWRTETPVQSPVAERCPLSSRTIFQTSPVSALFRMFLDAPPFTGRLIGFMPRIRYSYLLSQYIKYPILPEEV